MFVFLVLSSIYMDNFTSFILAIIEFWEATIWFESSILTDISIFHQGPNFFAQLLVSIIQFFQ